MASSSDGKTKLSDTFGLSKQKSAAGKGGGDTTNLVGAMEQEHPPEDSLFAEERQQRQSYGDDNAPWWKANFFLKEPVLFGTWDGVFTSVMVNIFGVIVFIRMGWIVAQAGVAHSVLILLFCASLALVPVLSCVGICERCQIQSGGLYFLLSHILGARIGGAVGILYSFAQCVGTSLVAVGFGESMAHLLGGTKENIWLVRFVAIVILAILAGVNLAGVIWVVKLQLALLALLVLAVIDFAIGSLWRYDPADGVVGLNSTNFQINIPSMFKDGETFFSVFGVFFSNFIGVLAGVNMSGDLKDPSNNIPLGELSAIGASSSFCFIFIMLLGATCTRDQLFINTMIAERVSCTRLLFLAGLYVSSLSSILGSMYGAPRVLQGIAAENVIPAIRVLEVGKGPNKNPVYAMLAMTALSVLFILIGDLNSLALISVIPFLITYAYVNYAYVSLAFTYDIQQTRLVKTGKAILPGYGSMGNIKGSSDLDTLFPERQVVKGARLQQQPRQGDPESQTTQQSQGDGKVGIDGPMLLEKDGETKPAIVQQQISWYSAFCNRWVSFIGTVVNFMIIFPMHFWYATITVVAFIAIYMYIGKASPGLFPGITEFSIAHMCETLLSKFRGETDDEQVVVTPLHPGVDIGHERQNDDNADYATRKQYHQTKTRQMETDFD